MELNVLKAEYMFKNPNAFYKDIFKIKKTNNFTNLLRW